MANRKTIPLPCNVHLNEDDVRARLESARGGSSVEDQADIIGVSWQYLYKMRSGDRPPNKKVLDHFKLDKVVMYQTRNGKK